jgi:hypothetical protein
MYSKTNRPSHLIWFGVYLVGVGYIAQEREPNRPSPSPLPLFSSSCNARSQNQNLRPPPKNPRSTSSPLPGGWCEPFIVASEESGWREWRSASSPLPGSFWMVVQRIRSRRRCGRSERWRSRSGRWRSGSGRRRSGSGWQHGGFRTVVAAQRLLDSGGSFQTATAAQRIQTSWRLSDDDFLHMLESVPVPLRCHRRSAVILILFPYFPVPRFMTKFPERGT